MVPAGAIALGACALLVIIALGHADQASAAAIVATTSIAAATGYVIARGVRLQRSRVARTVIALSALVVAVVALAPALGVMLPGRPDAAGELRAAGDTMAVPLGARGRVRLLISGTPQSAAGTVRVKIDGGRGLIVASLHRKHVKTARGDAGHVRSSTVTAYVEATLPDSSAELELSEIDPPGAGPILVRVYRVYLSHAHLLALYLLGLVVIVVVEWQWGPGIGMSIAGTAVLIYGIQLRGGVTPAVALTPALLGILPSALFGLVASLAVRYVVRRLAVVRGARARRGGG